MMLHMKRINIAIDGPAGAGKSTVAKLVARELNFLYIDTGAMYRALTWKALSQGLDFNDEAALTRLANNTNIVLSSSEDNNILVFVDGQEVTEAIREPVISQHVSYLARVAWVRTAMVDLQQQMAQGGGVVMDGRDIGTFVLPEAQCKIFLVASIEERAQRRYKELTAKGLQIDLPQLIKEMAERDRLDSEREVAPLMAAQDAVILDSSGKSIGQVVEEILTYARRTGDVL